MQHLNFLRKLDLFATYVVAFASTIYLDPRAIQNSYQSVVFDRFRRSFSM